MDTVPELVAPCPKILWIELTSKCPFDCVFCSRKHERGAGAHMSFELYESLIRQLDRPEVIRLNYSGESMHYPRLADAIRLARATGATTELVSALGSASQANIEALADNGLHRLSISIHSLDSAQFRTIYGYGEISGIRDRLEYLRQYKARLGTVYPEIDFAFVAMDENLGQLGPVVEYAASLGVRHVSVHPVIRRGSAPVPFPGELENSGRLRAGFGARVSEAAKQAAGRTPGVTVQVARPDQVVAAPTASSIATCEQNPWETVHVLENGAVVVCEVQDRVEIGNLRDETLAEIWHGAKYREFRQRYVNGKHPACAGCPWRRSLDVSVGKRALVRGWHPASGETVEWSAASAAMVVGVQEGVAGIRVAGLLPPGPAGGEGNTLQIRHAGVLVEVVNRTEELLPFHASVPVGAAREAVVRFDTRHRFIPAERGYGPDLRNLGYALTGLSLEYDAKRHVKVERLLRLLRTVERARWPVGRAAGTFEHPVVAGISVVVPARDTPDLLGATLSAAVRAIERAGEPGELIAVVSGAEAGAYGELRQSFPGVRWIFRSEVLAFGSAVELGLARAKHPWVYLLNSDMHLRPHALLEAMKARRADTFAVGSRIRMQDGSGTETNWTDMRATAAGAAELIERNADDVRHPRGCLYVGGGSGLFRASLLKRFIRRTRAYAPFYWEDVEWGAMAWRHGYSCTFCPASEAVHGHRQTVARYYSEAEVSRVFERNRLLFHLRNLSELRCLEEPLLSLGAASWAEIFRPRALLGTAWARAAAFAAPFGEEVLRDRWKLAH